MLYYQDLQHGLECAFQDGDCPTETFLYEEGPDDCPGPGKWRVRACCDVKFIPEEEWYSWLEWSPVAEAL